MLPTVNVCVTVLLLKKSPSLAVFIGPFVRIAETWTQTANLDVM